MPKWKGRGSSKYRQRVCVKSPSLLIVAALNIGSTAAPPIILTRTTVSNTTGTNTSLLCVKSFTSTARASAGTSGRHSASLLTKVCFLDWSATKLMRELAGMFDIELAARMKPTTVVEILQFL